MLILQKIVLIVVHIVAYRRSREEFDEILKTYEETAVFPVLAVDLFARFDGPFARFVTPVAVPLFHAVRVADFQQTVLDQVCCRHDFGPDQ